MVKKKKELPILVRPVENFEKDDIEVRWKPHYVGSSCLHWHDYYEMEVVTGGEGSYLVNGRTYPLRRGSVYLVTPADFHRIFGNLSLYNLSFHESVLPDSLLKPLISADTSAVADFSQESFAPVENALTMLFSEYRGQEELRRESMQSLVQYLVIAFLRKQAGQRETAAPVADLAVMQMVSYIRLHFKQKITLSMAAAEVFLTPNYAGALFYEKMGVSFHTYLMQVRLNYARSLLLLQGCSVEEAALTAGFSSPTYFSGCFKRVYGSTPGQWTKKRNEGAMP